jgi:coupling of ubiquitin conjugation to ER degradation protein 1
MAESQPATLNIPQLLVLLVLGFLVFRWYYSGTAATSATPAAQRGIRVNPAQVEQLMSMFPQLDRRSVMWALQSNGGNVARITEIVLAGRGLDVVCSRKSWCARENS